MAGRDKPRRPRQDRPQARELRPLPPGSSIGDFGVDRAPLDVHFGYFGARIRVNPQLSDLDMVDFMETATQLDENDPRSITFLKDHLRTQIHTGDFDEFWALSRQHRQTFKDLAAVSRGIIQATTGRPTSRPADSSAGPQPTEPASKGDSSSQVIHRLERQGRGDLASVVALAQRARRAG